MHVVGVIDEGLEIPIQLPYGTSVSVAKEQLALAMNEAAGENWILKCEIDLYDAMRGNEKMTDSQTLNYETCRLGIGIHTAFMLVNCFSKRRLFAEENGESAGQSWEWGFGASPESAAVTEDQFWDIREYQNSGTATITNAASGRRLYAQHSSDLSWKTRLGAAPRDTQLEWDQYWYFNPNDDGSYEIINAESRRRLFAQVNHSTNYFKRGVGAAPPASQKEPDQAWTFECIRGPAEYYIQKMAANMEEIRAITDIAV